MTDVARVLASRRISVSRISSATASATFDFFQRLEGHNAWVAQIGDLRLVTTHKRIVKNLLGQIDLLG